LNYDTGINSSMYIGQVVLQFPLVGYATVPPYNEYLAVIILLALAFELLYDRRMSRKEQQPAPVEGTDNPKFPPS